MKGDRVGAYISCFGNVMTFLGYGMHEGKFLRYPLPPFEVWAPDHASLNPDELRHRRHLYELMHDAMCVPRIRLDRGGIVWTTECRWGSVEQIDALIAKALVVVELAIERDSEGNPDDIAYLSVSQRENTDAPWIVELPKQIS